MTGTRSLLALQLSLLSTVPASLSCGQGTEPRAVLDAPRTKPATAAASDAWRATPVQALAIDPVTPGTLYEGTIDRGVFKSTDGGANWTSIRAADAGVTSIVINPVTPSTVYVGTSGFGPPVPGTDP